MEAVGGLWDHLLGFDEASWDSTSPIPGKRVLDPDLLEKGLGEMGVVPISIEVWYATVPKSFSCVCKEPLPTKPLFVEASIMLNTLTKKYVEMFIIDDTGTLVGIANVGAFVIPKNASKCSFIFHLAALNTKSLGRPP